MYRITGIINCNALADNNTWNSSHTTEVGLCTVSGKNNAWKGVRYVDAEYYKGCAFCYGNEMLLCTVISQTKDLIKLKIKLPIVMLHI